jgi:hypothetical protein
MIYRCKNEATRKKIVIAFVAFDEPFVLLLLPLGH